MSLEALGKALYLEVLELKKERERALESRTLAGHAKNLMGYMLSAYCLYKYVLLRTSTCDGNSMQRCVQ
jgi:golgi pH regulator